MMKVIKAALNEAESAAREQSELMQNELNSAADALLAAKVQFEDDMKLAASTAQLATAMRADAVAVYEVSLQEAHATAELSERQRSEAVRGFDTQMTQLSAVLIGMQKQLGAGEMVTGLRGGEPRRPKLLHGGAHA